MSKRSGLSRWEDLKRWFIDVGRYRYILHKFDMERWRDTPCPSCGIAFTEEPRYYAMGIGLHWEEDCTEKFWNDFYARQEEEEDDWWDETLINQMEKEEENG